MASFSTREEPDGLVITVDDPSSLNDFRSSTFRDALYEFCQTREAPRIALEMEAVDYLSSSGVAILVGLKRRLEAKGGKVALCGVQPVVYDLLRVMKLNSYFDFADDASKALATLRPVPSV